MGIWAIRVFFALIMGGLGWQVTRELSPGDEFWGILIAEGFYWVVVCVEILVAKGSPAGFAAVVMGLIMGFILAYLIYLVTVLTMSKDDVEKYGDVIQLILTVFCCYLCMAVIFKTRERFRFIIPYVEFKREHKGPKVILVDSSAIIDGRLAEVCQVGAIDGPLLVPTFVLRELHGIADSSDKIKRRRGRRGLDILNRLRRSAKIDVEFYEAEEIGAGSVDGQLIELATELDAKLLTCDRNLQKLAALQSVSVMNLNELANALRPSVMPGERVVVPVIRPGEERAQGVGFLDDGTMVVVENGGGLIGREVSVEVLRTIQTASGKLLFARAVETASS